jgi:GNAT superfamily N-acetyltransferase
VTPDMRAHLERVHDDLTSGSFPQSRAEVLQHFAPGTHYGFDWLTGAAHWHLASSPRSPHRETVSVAVERVARRLGRGSAMLRMAERDAKKRGVEWLDGWLWEDNEPALKMDLAFGFTVVGRLEDAWRYPDGRGRTMLLVAKRIGP